MPLARHAKAAPVPTVQEPLTVQFLAVIEDHSTELESSPGELDFSFPVSQGLVAALPGEFPGQDTVGVTTCLIGRRIAPPGELHIEIEGFAGIESAGNESSSPVKHAAAPGIHREVHGGLCASGRAPAVLRSTGPQEQAEAAGTQEGSCPWKHRVSPY